MIGQAGAQKIGKACEPCRRRKIRCSGLQPCDHCARSPSTTTACVYRSKARVKKTRSSRASGGRSIPYPATPPAITETRHGSEHNEPSSLCESDPHPNVQVHQSVTATHGTELTPESSQLFYGPSSNFAFTQQVHRGILARPLPSNATNSEVQEGGPGLDMFMQRAIFFGPPSRPSIPSSQHSGLPIPLEQAKSFLELFKAGSRYILPFYTDSELEEMLHALATESASVRIVLPQQHSVTLAILAIGALSTDQTGTAELLFTMAKSTGAVYEDAVTLQMIQHSLILADYQINMGRPNSAYLHLGVACRKAFAMGLHKEAANILAGQEDLRKRRATLWCLYFHESWHSLALGRQNGIRMSDISCPFPDDPYFVVGLCQLASIAEDGTEAIYGRRYQSLRQLFTAAEKILGRLRAFADKFNIGSSNANMNRTAYDEVGRFQMHNLYYHAMLLTFRPFLIAKSVLRGKNMPQMDDQMWLQQACRYAIDAAQDSIVFASNKIRTNDICKGTRYNAFFLESSCAVLLYDILLHPAKYSYNLEFIQTAIGALDTMFQDEPIANSRKSILQILQVVEQRISASLGDRPSVNQIGALHAQIAQPASAEMMNQDSDQLCTSVLFPSRDKPKPTVAEELICFSDRIPQPLHIPSFSEADQLSESTGLPGPDQDMTQLFNFNFDVLTTDLYNLFPMQITTPEDHVNQDS